jgi:site-specific DNA recombinase
VTSAAIYARYSSDHQREASIDDQMRICSAFVSRQGWSPQTVYSDHALSGATTLRPGYQRLLEDARAGRYDVLVAESLDRLSRDQADVATLYKLLSFCGVRIVTVAEGEISELHVGLKGTMNALYLKDLAQKTRRGLEGRVRAGRSGGGLCYGYGVVYAPGRRGEAERGGRRINEQEAAIVMRVFTEYARGKSPRRIAFDLNADHVPGPSGKDWSASTINGNRARGTGILNNELYIGRLVWNRLKYVKDPRTGKRISRQNPEEDWIINSVPDLRIVSDDLWQRVKGRQGEATRDTRPDLPSTKPFWERTRPKYLFSGLMKCGRCGGSYTKISANLFGCATARNKGTCDNRLNVRRDTLEEQLLDCLRSKLMDPDLFREFAEEFYREINRVRMNEAAALDHRRRAIASIDRKIHKLVDAITGGADALSLNRELVALERRKQDLEREPASPASPKPLIHPNLAEVYRRRVADLHQALYDKDSAPEAFELIRALVAEITLTPDDGQLRIDLRGELAAILNLCSESKKPASQMRHGPEQIKMVAGAGFEPATFRL